VTLDLQVQLAILDQLDILVQPGQQGRQVILVRQEQEDQLVIQDLLVPPERLLIQAQPDQRGILEIQDLQVLLDQGEVLLIQVLQELLELLVIRVQLVLRGQQQIQAQPDQRDMEQQATLEILDQLAPLDKQETPDLLAQPVQQVIQVLLVILALLDHLDILEIQDILE
jgi:hypothetical protein